MTMKFSQLTTYWEAEEAHAVIAFLDELRDLLWATYGDHIVQNLQNTTPKRVLTEEQLDLNFGDKIPF